MSNRFESIRAFEVHQEKSFGEEVRWERSFIEGGGRSVAAIRKNGRVAFVALLAWRSDEDRWVHTHSHYFPQ